MIYKIIKILSIEPYSVVCEFNTGEVREIDLSEWVAEFKANANGWTSKLADPGYFITAKVADYGTLVWGDDIDFDPYVLYTMSKPASKTTKSSVVSN